MSIGISKESQLGKAKKKKKATNKSNNPYFAWLRETIPECIICGSYSEIHHIEFGYKRDDKRVVMLCTHHHSAQSMDGIHHDTKLWYKKYYTFKEIEIIADCNYDHWMKESGDEL